ncbi:MAG TPA: amino acid ABC transporter substrate-binding protein [Casimicrobiaceae bacterium]|nr:amino acid ABC transporter substrate-binding protein [Casimicrobiaceae bacterium]
MSSTTGGAAVFTAACAKGLWGRVRSAGFAVLTSIAIVAAFAAQAQTSGFVPKYTGTLKKIAESGVVRVGHRENSPPFAFLDADKKPVGYSLDLCEIVVEEIQSELAKDIRVELIPVTPENRFDKVTSGEIDIECGSTTNNAERRKIVAFSPTMFVTGTKLMVRRGSGILNFRNLADKTVVLTRGTVHETAVPKLAERQKLPIKFVFAPDHRQSFETLRAGKADAFANDDVQLYGMLAETKSAADFRVVGDFLTYADYALMFRKDDPDFAEVVERAFQRLAGSREITAIYERWFQKPLPSGIRLNMPMSPHLEELFRVQGLPSD